MREALVWFLTAGVPGLPTVSYAEATWNAMALVSSCVAFWARSKWVVVARNLTRTNDRGARAIAGLIDWTCRSLIALGLAEVLASVPGLRLPPRTDVGTSDSDLMTLALVPLISFAISAGVVALSVHLAYVTRSFVRGRYRGDERRVGQVPGYVGPFRRTADLRRGIPSSLGPPADDSVEDSPPDHGKD